jgi:cell division protein FtsN
MNANRPYDDELPGRGYPSRTDPDTGDHEISLGTPTILGIFFALVLVCAAFFGFGYTLGRRSAPATAIVSDPLSTSSTPKPAAGSAAAQTIPAAQPSAAPVGPTAIVPLNAAAAVIPASTQPVATVPQPAIAAQPASVSPQTAAFVVQVAAVSSQDVADILTSSLQKKGYTVAVRHEPQDKLLHVQIGPFTDKKEAQAMQARVLADGFNAIVK